LVWWISKMYFKSLWCYNKADNLLIVGTSLQIGYTWHVANKTTRVR
jgi:hypothetical protein